MANPTNLSIPPPTIVIIIIIIIIITVMILVTILVMILVTIIVTILITILVAILITILVAILITILVAIFVTIQSIAADVICIPSDGNRTTADRYHRDQNGGKYGCGNLFIQSLYLHLSSFKSLITRLPVYRLISDGWEFICTL